MTVFCGHTHSPGAANPLPNLEIFTGGAQYGAPNRTSLGCDEARLKFVVAKWAAALVKKRIRYTAALSFGINSMQLCAI